MTDKEKAKAAKDEGNKEFKAGNYEAALACYDRAIALDTTEALYANRSAVCLKLKRWRQAEADATAAILINDTYAKVQSTINRRLIFYESVV